MKPTQVSVALTILEADRSKLLEEFLGLGDLRPGSITALIRRCGKPACYCAKPKDTGRDPQFFLTRRVAGKTRTETFPNPVALRKPRAGNLYSDFDLYLHGNAEWQAPAL